MQKGHIPHTRSPFEMVDESDLLACVRLLKAVVAGGFSAGIDRACTTGTRNPAR